MLGGEFDEREQCIAVTASGERCSRLAKNADFCFQHDESSETVELESAERPGVVNWLSTELDARAAQASGVQRDVLKNISDGQDELRGVIRDVRSGHIGMKGLFDHLVSVARRTGGAKSIGTIGGAVIGGFVGTFFGPAGTYSGIVLGSSAGFYFTEGDDRVLIGVLAETPPQDAEIVPSDHEAIADIDPIQIVIESAVENESEDWIRQTRTRAWDMNAIEEALEALEPFQAEEHPPGGYYVQDVESGEIVVLVFGEPGEGFPDR